MPGRISAASPSHHKPVAERRSSRARGSAWWQRESWSRSDSRKGKVTKLPRWSLWVCVLAVETGFGAFAVGTAASDRVVRGSRASAPPPRVVALLLAEGFTPAHGIAIVALSGKRFPVPARVRDWPLGLSPDSRLVAGFSGGRPYSPEAVTLGKVRGGSMKEILRGTCSASVCPRGADPSFAWSPDSRRLAAAAIPRAGSTLLRLFDRSGRLVRSLKLPARNPERGGRAYHRLVSWSPDGSRLLLKRMNAYFDTAVLTVDVDTGRVRTLARIEAPQDSPTVTWSPNGRLVVLTSAGFSSRDYSYAVIDVANARPIVRCNSGSPCDVSSGSVWAPNSRSLFKSSGKDILRVDLAGRRTRVGRSNTPYPLLRAAFSHYLLYETISVRHDEVVRDTLFVLDLTTHREKQIVSLRTGVTAIMPLTRIP
jgi:hypothetical protein